MTDTDSKSFKSATALPGGSGVEGGGDVGGGGSGGGQSVGRDPELDGSMFTMSYDANYTLGTDFRGETALTGESRFIYSGTPFDGPGMGVEVLLRTWLSKDGRIDNRDYLVDSADLSLQYNSNGSYSSTGSKSLPDDMVSGAYQLIFEADVVTSLPRGAVTSITWQGRDNGKDDIYFGDAAPGRDSTRDLFADAGGKAPFLADLALAAYHLETGTGQETTRKGANDLKSASEDAYSALPDGFQLMDGKGSLALTIGAKGKFPGTGLSNGIYTSSNAAALVGRSDDALFLSFRGTNGDGDVTDWGLRYAHFGKFGLLIDGLRDYLRDNREIETLYVSGHSLGGAMVQAFVEENGRKFAGVKIEAISFASPGIGLDGDFVDHAEQTLSNFRVAGDIVPWVNAVAGNTSGDINTIVTYLEEDKDTGNVTKHSMALYAALADFLAGEGITSTQIGGIDYDLFMVKTDVAGRNSDRFTFGEGKDTIVALPGQDALIFGGAKADLLVGDAGRDGIYGGGGKDTITGGSKTDHLFGGGANDLLIGERGIDYLFGGAGEDTLEGGSGRDWLEGGAGADRFFIGDHKHSKGDDADRITDWDAGRAADVIDLSGIDARTGALGNRGDQDFRWIGDFGFSEFKGELRYFHAGNRTTIEGDRNGDGRADFEIVLSGRHDLTADDFIL